MRCLVLLGLLALAACGADGEPETPGIKPGLTVSGSVEVGITGGG